MGKAIITRILNKGGTPPHQYPHQYRDEHRDEYRVAVYCRVAAWGEGQENNYMNVSNYYKQSIRMNSGWKLVSIYADVGLTRVQTRPRFFDMLRDGQSGFFDILICESVRTFSHDMKDAVEKIRKLKSWGVKVIFEREGFDTNSYITSSLLETLNSFGNEDKNEPFSPVFGYRLVRDEYGDNNSNNGEYWEHSECGDDRDDSSQEDYGGQDENGDENGECFGYCEIVPEEAAIVKNIFNWYEHGALPSEILKCLYRAARKDKDLANILGIEVGVQTQQPSMLSKAGKLYKPNEPNKRSRTDSTANARPEPDWNNEADIYNMLQDERYVGDLGTQSNHHKAIITRPQFDRCSIIMDMKDLYPFGSLLRCPYCGHSLTQRFIFEGVHFLCEGEGACRQFVILAEPIKEALLDAWNDLTRKTIIELLGVKNAEHVEAKRLLIEKKKNPEFDDVDYWWLDEYMLRITFGRHLTRQQQQNRCTGCDRDEQSQQSGNTHSDDNQSEYSNDNNNKRSNTWSCRVTKTKAQHTINTVWTGRNRFNEAGRYGEQDEGCNIIVYWKCGIITTLPSMAQSASQNPRRKALLWDKYLLQHSDLYPDLAAEAVTARFRNRVNDSNSIQANSSNNYRGNYRGGNSINSSNSNGGNYRCNLSQRANNTNNDFSDYEEND